MPAPQIIHTLVERFEQNIESYKSGNYNETQARQEFINPFFEALGWDISNTRGYAEAYKDVVHEYSQKTSDSVEAPDYLFKIGGIRKFFVEAKKPSVNLKDDFHPAFQLRRYAWSAKLPLSVLTDFEEFSIYDCRFKPEKTDKPSNARIRYYNYKEYVKNWDEIESVFSRDSVLKGSFDKFADANKKVKGGQEVDDAFLKEIESWREQLAKNIALRNPDLSNRELNFSVQKTIDRIIFLRICEDRGIEDYGELMALQNGVNIYARLLQKFKSADDKYNSGLFHFKDEKNRPGTPDDLTTLLNIDDKVLKDIFRNLYYPECPYEFSVLGADILGQVYEQFLGKVIRLTAGHMAKVEDKPEVKKAGGVYYTPTYIVNYIVKNTVGKLVENKKPKQVEKLKILDPACGSGSFLLGAYQFLLDWHLNFYTKEENPEILLNKKESPVYVSESGEYKLTTSERKRILLNNIYGVDIDSQAVEVTKLSLLLKVLEGETEQSLTNQLSMFKQRALPDLADNIKCGNSLIGYDFYEQDEIRFSDDEKIMINTFGWSEEYSEIMKDGGFDIILGNPPWIDIKGLEPRVVDYYFDKYSGSENRINVFATFIEKSVLLLNKSGLLGFITPSSYLTQSSYKNLRIFLYDTGSLYEIVRLPDKVFKKVIAETVISLFSKKNQKQCLVKIFDANQNINSIKDEKTLRLFDNDIWGNNENKVIDIFTNDCERKIISKIAHNSVELNKICDFSLGITPYDKYRGHSQAEIKNRVFHSTKKINKYYKPLLAGSNIKRYSVKWDNKEYIKYGNWLGAPRDKKFFVDSRILVRQIISGNPLRIYAGFTTEEFYNTQSIFNIILKPESDISIIYLLAIINSKLMTFYHRKKFLDEAKNVFQKILIQDAKQFPIKSSNNKIILLIIK